MTKRLNLEMANSAWRSIQDLMQRTGTESPAELIVKVLSLYDLVIQGRELSRDLCFRDPDGTIQEIEVQ